MASNLLVRRSTAGLLRLVRRQAATFATWLPSRSVIRQLPKTRDVNVVMKAFSGLEKLCRKYNLVKDTSSIDEILDSNKGFQKFLLHIERFQASEMLCSYKRSMTDFREDMIILLFWDHLVLYVSLFTHDKIHMDEALKFKEAFSLPSTKRLHSKAEDYYFTQNLYYKVPPRELPTGWFFKENEENKIETRKFYEKHMSLAVMREIEEDIMKIYQEITAKRDPDGKSTAVDDVSSFLPGRKIRSPGWDQQRCQCTRGRRCSRGLQ